MHSVLVTGPIGAGKSSALAVFEGEGWLTRTADDIVAELQAVDGAAFQPILDRFPETKSATESGEAFLNRKVLRELVFNNVAERKALEDILHPLVRDAIGDLVKNHAERNMAIEIPLVTSESPYLQMFDHVLVITAPDAALVRKAEQTNIDLDLLRRIRETQPSYDSYMNLASAHISNEGDETDLVNQVQAFIASLS